MAARKSQEKRGSPLPPPKVKNLPKEVRDKLKAAINGVNEKLAMGKNPTPEYEGQEPGIDGQFRAVVDSSIKSNLEQTHEMSKRLVDMAWRVGFNGRC